MRIFKTTLLFALLCTSAYSKTKSRVTKAAPKATTSSPAYKFNDSDPQVGALRQQLSQALNYSKNGQYLQAASSLYNLAKKPELSNEKAQIKYILGLMLMETKMNQVAAFQFVDVIRMNSDRYRKQALEKLSLVADSLGDDTLLNYAISRIDIDDVPATSQEMINFRLGEIKQKNKRYEEAIAFYSKVPFGSSFYNQAIFNRGLTEMESNRLESAIKSFQVLLSLRGKAGVTDTNRVAAQLALARAYYQKQDWDEAVEAYSRVPRDHFLWHDALFEQTWSMLRSVRFRSALSNLQSLHSAYYEDFYIPESLLLRAIVYLYICKYDEMEKVLTLFEKSYGPVRAKVSSFIRNFSDPTAYYNEIEKAQVLKKGDELKGQLKLPYMVLKTISDEGDVRRGLAYIKRISEEKQYIENTPSLRGSNIGQYGIKLINTRMKNTKISIGEMVRVHLQNMDLELKDLFEQASFVRYEMINGKKESLKKRIAGKTVTSTIDEDTDRDFYVKNGYDYYPFQGEYWLDEIGNYHYLGKQSCE